MYTFLTIFIISIITINPLHAMGSKPTVSLDQKIGQMILIGFNGTTIDSPNFAPIQQHIASENIGGLLFFGRNIQSKSQIINFIKDIKNLNTNTPLFLAIDQEGGTVQRLNSKNGFFDTPSAKYIGSKLSPPVAASEYDKMARMLQDTGFNLNFGLVLDLDLNPQSQVISQNDRAISKNPYTVTQYAQRMIHAHKAHRVLITAKHFPGHGNTTADSHHETANITDTWDKTELLPYKQLIKDAPPDAIMTGHLMHTKIDAHYPASLSKAHIDTLRYKMRFSGIIITDDLNMAAITTHYSLKTTIIHAINAGNDILLFGDITQTPNLPIETRGIIKKAIKDGELNETQISTAYKRIQRIKEGLSETKL
ncbi:MAG: glycoside hydrolase family 3 [bacterium]|nr:glycoside hydrolase family 3 [bacterium]